jgi:thiol peroxidase
MKTTSLNKFLFASLIINSLLTFNVQAYSQDSLNQTQNLVKANNKYVTLLGTQVAINDLAPNFKVVDKKFTPVQLSVFKGQTV